jgi:hypothetical protein
MEYHYRISYIVQELPFVIDYTAATQDKKINRLRSERRIFIVLFCSILFQKQYGGESDKK